MVVLVGWMDLSKTKLDRKPVGANCTMPPDTTLKSLRDMCWLGGSLWHILSLWSGVVALTVFSGV